MNLYDFYLSQDRLFGYNIIIAFNEYIPNDLLSVNSLICWLDLVCKLGSIDQPIIRRIC